MKGTRPILRTCALLIAALGAIDPAITTTRHGRPEVALLATDATADSALLRVIRQRLSQEFRVVAAPLPPVAATIVVGGHLPPPDWTMTGPMVVVVPDSARDPLQIESFAMPSEAHLEGTTTLTARVRVMGTGQRTLIVQLRERGRLVHEATQGVPPGETQAVVSMPFLPVAPGAAPLRLSVSLTTADGTVTRHADGALQVRAAPWRILAFDRRPSWHATFLRRSLEQDPRFEVTSRTVTSRNVSTGRGAAPDDLARAAALDAFDVVIVGAPDQLTSREVHALDIYLRQRGGRVIVLPETRVEAPYQALLGAGQWQHDSGGRHLRTVAVDSGLGALRGADLLWPERLPSGGDVIATANVRGVPRPVVWRTAVGAGEVVVAGVADAWQSRDPELSDFDRFWRGLVGALASTALPSVQATLDRTVVSPTDSVSLAVMLRDVALSEARDSATVTVAAVVEDATGAGRSIRLWPEWSRGMLRGTLPPLAAGEYRVRVAQGGEQRPVPLMVADAAPAPRRSTGDLLLAWAAGKDGTVLGEERVSQLPDALRRIMLVAARPERWHPMRSPWWIIPFAALLSVEWWLRRREGER